MSNETQNPHKSAALWATQGHGRSPTLQMRHTVDDKLMVATHVSFLPLRVVLHRNGDDMVIYSEELLETRFRDPSAPSASPPLPMSRSLVITTGHVYLVLMPTRGVFSPCSVGNCFRMSELCRVCSVQDTAHIVIQFVNGVLALQGQKETDTARLANVLFSATGIRSEVIQPEEETAASSSGGIGALRDQRRYSASLAPSAASSNTTNTTKNNNHDGRSVAPSEAYSRGVDSVLKQILHMNTGGDVRLAFPDSSTQTETLPTMSTAVGTVNEGATFCDRSTSPMVFLTQRGTVDDSEMDSQSDRTASTANSEFDAADVWKSLRKAPSAFLRTPPAPAAAAPRAQAVGGRMPSPGHRREDAHFTEERLEKRRTDTVAMRGATPTSGLGHSDRLGGPDGTAGNNTGSAPAGSSSANQRDSDSNPLDGFLGVLAVYAPAFQKFGIDSSAKLLRLSEGDLDKLMDDAGITKQGHRMLMHSKVAIQRQSLSSTNAGGRSGGNSAIGKKSGANV